MTPLMITLSLAAGGLLGVQAGANAQLSKAIGSPIIATTLQLAVAMLLLAIAMMVTGGAWTLLRLSDVTWWHAAGGTASALYVVSTILLFPRIGAVVSVGLFIAGQVAASMLLDALGLLGVPAVGLSIDNGLGAIMVFTGAGLIVLGQDAGMGGGGSPRLAWLLLALVAGAALPVQGAVNALLRQDLGGVVFAVGTVSFVVATATMAIVLVAMSILSGWSWPKGDLSQLPWWAWLGGLAGATYVTTVFAAIPAIGAATTVGLTIAGQQVMSVVVDMFGWFRLPRRPVSTTRLAGVAALLAGVAVLTFA